ncbi:MAG: HIT domain-containing protein [Candidatus Krumholzibacteriia bacterium]
MNRLWAPWRSGYVEAASKSDASGCFLCDYGTEGSDAERRIVRRWKHWYAILNAYPYSNGHLMLVLKRHHEGFMGLRPEEAGELAPALERCEGAVREAYQPHGLNVGVNMGRVAGAGVSGHLHIHVVPRWNGDTNFMSSVGDTRVLPESLESSYEKLRAAFARQEAS